MNVKPTLILCLFLFSCSGKRVNIQSSVSDFYVFPKAYVKVYGKIKLITETGYFAHKQSGKIIKDSIKWKNIFSFNTAGNETEIISHYGDGSAHWKAINMYNEKGQLEKVNYYNSDGDLRYIFNYYYDTNGNLIECDDFTGDNFKIRTKTKYKYSGDSIEVTHFNKVDSFDHNSFLKKDKSGNIVRFIVNHHDGSLWFKDIFNYNKIGDRIVDSSFASDSSLSVAKSIYEDVDKEGNWRNRVIYNNNELHVTIRQIEYY